MFRFPLREYRAKSPSVPSRAIQAAPISWLAISSSARTIAE